MQMSDAGIARLLAEMDGLPGNEPTTGHEDATRSCARLGCDYPAPIGPYCGLHRGMDMASDTRRK